MPDLNTDVLNRSVTQGDYEVGRAYYWAVSLWPQSTHALRPDLYGLSLKESDFETISTVDHEVLWAGAVAIATTKVSSLSWEVQGSVPLRTSRGHELLLQSDAGNGWVSFISKLLQDFLLTDNGCFIEIVRQSSSINSQIIGLMPLDSLRCTRTKDPTKPVVYTDLQGRNHELQRHEVITMSDLPSPRADLLGSGKCAAHRAYTAIYKLSSIDVYINDKVTGRKPLAVYLINGLNDPQLRSVLVSAQAEADARGAVAYMGAILATVPGDTTPGVATIDLASFPDRFNRKEELDASILAYANNLGLDVQDLQPLSGRSLGTGAQSEVLEEKARGKGLTAFKQQFIHNINTWVLPDGTTMIFIEKDWRDKNLKAQHDATVEKYTTESAAASIITPAQGLQHLVDENVFPKEFLPTDTTPDTTLSDVEKPEDEVVKPPEQVPAAAPPAPVPPAGPTAPGEKKEKDDIDDLLAQEADAARALVKKVREKLLNPKSIVKEVFDDSEREADNAH